MAKKITILFSFSLLLLPFFLEAQGRTSRPAEDYPKINEDMFLETRWKYLRTEHIGSETVIHEASPEYEFFLNFKMNFNYQLYLNGDLKEGNWLVDKKGSQVYFNFRNIRWWQVSKLDRNHLILEFKIGNNFFNYVFKKATQAETAFFDGATGEAFADTFGNEETEEEVEKERKKPKKVMENITPPAPPTIEIQVVGGGYFGGIDPVLKDYIHLKPNGRLIREVETVQNGLRKTAKDIPREDMEKLIEFIESKNFFDFANTYDCTSGDCQRRKKMKPTPIPLTLVVRHGSKRKVVVITIYGQDDRRGKYINYPKEIDIILQNIKLIAE